MFECGVSTVFDIDQNEYNTVLIGNQCWMRENLKTEHLADANTTEIGAALAPSHDQPSFYYPDQSQDNVDAYGLLYNFAAVATGNLCPTGWHVPSDSEWTVLSDYVASVDGYGCGGYPTYTGKALASTEGWYEYAGDCSVGNQQSDNNATGFNMMPAGYFHQNSGYTNFSKQARFWTSNEDEYDPDYSAYNRSLYYFNSYLQNADNSFKSTGMSVRCVKTEVAAPQYTAPAVTTDSVTGETTTSAKVHGTVTDDGGDVITEYGFCMSTEGTPTLDDVVYVVGTNVSGSFSFDSTLTNLMPGSTYFVAAYAINSVDTAYGEELIINIEEEVVIDDFVCGDSTVVDIDNNLYNTVLIGNQCWLKENLKTTQYADGTPLTEGGATSEASYYYPENGKDPYGLLYSWVAVMGGSASSESNPSGVQGICPDGWHVPSNAEWDELNNYVNSQNDYLCDGYNAKAFASQEVWYSNNNGSCYIDGDVTTNNATGFSAIPVGFRYGGLYYNASSTVGYWSSTAADGDNIGVYLLKDTVLNMYYNSNNLSYAYSVRCVKD